MAQLKPTRQEYLKLKKKVKTASRGHRLLKDKRDGLIQKFLGIVKEALLLRKELDQPLVRAIELFRYAEAKTSESFLASIAQQSEAEVQLKLETSNFMGVHLPTLEAHVAGDPFTYGVLNTPKDLDTSLVTLHQILPKLVRLAELEYTARKLAEEIEKTRRRVNALEYVIIPEMQTDMAYIQGVLEERSRQEKVTIMKVKELLDL